MRKHATTIVLVLLAALLTVWLFVDRDKITEGERKRRENSVFSAWRKEELSRIEIAHEGETIVLVRDAKKESAWRMTSPRADRSDQAAVERLTSTLELAGVARKLGASTEGGALGFEQPRASGSITMGGLVLRFVLGAPSPRPEGSSYFRVEGEPPIVVSKELTQALLQGSDTYRDRTVVPYLSVDLARFEVKHAGGGFALERLDERSFRVGGAGVLASRQGVERVWASLAEMRAESFADEAEAERLTKDPQLTIVMTPRDGKKPPAELRVGGVCPGHPDDVVVFRKEPTKVAACAPKAALDALLLPSSFFVELRAFSLRTDEMEEVRLEWLGDADAGGGAPKAIELARKGTGFKEREPVDHDLSADEVDAATVLLKRISDVAALTALKDGTEPFTAVAQARVRFGPEEQIVEIGPVSAIGEARVVLRRKIDGARLEVMPSAARALLPRVTSLKSRKLVTDARRVTRMLLRCGAPQELVDSGDGFRLVEPKGYESDAGIVTLVEALSRGKVDAWIADSIDGGFGLADESCRVVLGFEDNNAPLTIRFGSDFEGGVFGTIEGTNNVFIAPKSLKRLSSELYVSRASLRVEPWRIERVRVTERGKPVTGIEPSAAATLFADKVVRIGNGAGTGDVGAPDLTIEVAVSEGGPPKRVVCGAPNAERKRLCATDGLRATFEVPGSRFALLFGQTSDAGSDADVARDGGTR